MLVVRAIVAALLLTTASARHTAQAAEIPDKLAALVQRKEAIAADLAQQISSCVSRRDTGNPAFRGCIDWHSAVHGTWALVAYERATGDRQYSALVASILQKELLEKERLHLRQAPQFEMPYGRAWFLRLAIERGLMGSNDLSDFADEVAQSLRNYFSKTKIDRSKGEYNSASWALMNLIDYARFRKNTELENEVTGWVKQNFVDADLKCSAELEKGEFMAVCTNWAALVSRVLAHEEYQSWLEKFLKLNRLPDPVTVSLSAHHHGLNFSRAWGLWDMYNKTARPDIADAYVEHFNNGLVPNSNWKGNYSTVGHWVAQFGMFALQPLFGEKGGR